MMQSPENKSPISNIRSKEIPFRTAIVNGLAEQKITINEALELIPQRALQGWIAWQYTRTVDNPFLKSSEKKLPLIFDNGRIIIDGSQLNQPIPTTGFEGYYVDQNYENGLQKSIEIAKKIAHTGKKEIDIIKIIHPHDHAVVYKMFKILNSNQARSPEEMRLLVKLHSIFGGILARHRSMSTTTPKSERYRQATLSGLQSTLTAYIFSTTHESGLIEQYMLPPPLKRNAQQKPSSVLWSEIPDADRVGYLFMSLIGKMGHPLLRLAISGIDRIK